MPPSSSIVKSISWEDEGDEGAVIYESPLSVSTVLMVVDVEGEMPRLLYAVSFRRQ